MPPKASLWRRLYTFALSLGLVLESLLTPSALLYLYTLAFVSALVARDYFAAFLSIGCPRTCKVVPAQSVYDTTEASRYPAASRAPEIAFLGVPSELRGPRMCKVLPAWRVYDTPRQVVTLQRQLASVVCRGRTMVSCLSLSSTSLFVLFLAPSRWAWSPCSGSHHTYGCLAIARSIGAGSILASVSSKLCMRTSR